MGTAPTHFNNLTPAEDERLALLLEECGEVIQIVGKIQRHGYESKAPSRPMSDTNRLLLEHELGDLINAIQLMDRAKDVRWQEIDKQTQRKRNKVKKYLHHQPRELL